MEHSIFDDAYFHSHDRNTLVNLATSTTSHTSTTASKSGGGLSSGAKAGIGVGVGVGVGAIGVIALVVGVFDQGCNGL